MLGALKFSQLKRSFSRKIGRSATVVSYEEHINKSRPPYYNYDQPPCVQGYLYDPAPVYTRKGKPIFRNQDEAANWLVEHLLRELI
jgi:hypothetical protein